MNLDLPLLVVWPTEGLCNRLRVISSYDVLARRASRSFAVCWEQGQGWSEEDLADLFENDVPRVHKQTYEVLAREALRLDELVSISWVEEADRTWTSDSGTAFAQIFDTQRHPVVTYRGCRRGDDLLEPHRRSRELPGDFLQDYLAHLRSWRPVAPIRASVDEITAGFTAKTIGIHLRRGDVWKAMTRYDYRLSSDRSFTDRLDGLLETDQGQTFFLATDDEETQDRFVGRYGSAVITNPAKRFVPSVPYQPKQNQRDAVIDLFCLASTARVIGTRRSSFSRVAAELGDVVLETPVDRRFWYRTRLEADLAVTRARRKAKALVQAAASRRSR